MPSHEVYDDLSVCCELPILVDNMQIVTYAFMVLLSFFEACILIFLPECVFFG